MSQLLNMNHKSKNYNKTFSELKIDTSLNHIYTNIYSNIKFSNFRQLNYGIDSINQFSNNGIHYTNPLILAINRFDSDLVKELLYNGSSPRGYQKYPGYPLFKAIELLHIHSHNKVNQKKLIDIIQILHSFGAKFSDFITILFWPKFIDTLNVINDNYKKIILDILNMNPFTLIKYKECIDIFCVNSCMDKKLLIKNFVNHFPQNDTIVPKKKVSLNIFFFL